MRNHAFDDSPNWRLFRWAKQEWHREIQEDFPLLRLFAPVDPYSQVMVETMERQAPEKRSRLAMVFLKNAWLQDLDRWGEVYTEEERSLYAMYSAALHSRAKDRFNDRGLPDKACAAGWIMRAIRSPIEAVAGTFHSLERYHGTGIWRADVELGQGKLLTLIDIDSRFSSIKYTQTIQGVPSATSLRSHICAGTWLGIPGAYGGRYRCPEDMQLIAEAIAAGCARFRHAAPQIAGL